MKKRETMIKTISKDGSKMNEALVKQVELAKVKNHDVLSRGTGIDKSTVSLHLSGKRKISLDHAKKYSEFLKLPLIKVIDDKVAKYRIVRYIDENGIVTAGDENDFDVVICPNEIEAKDEKIIYNKQRQTAYWYNPDINCNNTETIGEYCYIKNSKEALCGVILKKTSRNLYLVKNRHTNKDKTMKIDVCYPISCITFTKFSTSTKIEDSL